MHTITQGTSEKLVVRARHLALSVAELTVALAWFAAMQLVTWQERARERRRLAALDDYLLRDMGLSRSQVESETSKRFWES